ncbi:MAG TPA: alcohol dehydrogenase catalytic domain-containing protein [Pseudonocardiaceae bacterium]|nr:alcohol dehydrogenase catalytic domain-containing protein [Pseudonocardiaceae bacterium]
MAQARSVLIKAPHRLDVVPDQPRQPAAGEALIRVAWAGICGSDRDVLAGHRPAEYVSYPLVPGHEWSGTVVEVGPDTPIELLGRKVVGEGFRSCRRCAACRRGETNLCDAGYHETGFTAPGAWADYLTLPARLLHVLPADADLRAAAVLEPAACIASACLRAAAVPGERVAVVGAGTLGLLAAQLLAAASPAELVVVHTRATREALAIECGATALVTADQVGALAGRFDAVIEAAGAPGTARMATTLARRGGRVVLTGLPAADDSLVPAEIVLGELTLHSVFGASSDAWQHAVRAFAAGVLRPGLLVTHEIALDDVADAFQVLAEERDSVVKVLLKP